VECDSGVDGPCSVTSLVASSVQVGCGLVVGVNRRGQKSEDTPCVRTEDLVQDLGVNDQYKKTYEGPSLIRDNPDTTNRMATRSHKRTPP
jgi:hypothetical protein